MLSRNRWIGTSGILMLVASIGLASRGMANEELVVEADDIIPQEEMADEDLLDLDRDFMRRATTKKELANHSARRVQIVVHKTMRETGRQHMEVFVDGNLQEIFTVSTAWERKVKGKSGRIYFASTPEGKFFPDSLERKRFSNLWQVWLHYVIPFSGGVWIHATTPDHYAELGAPASGGCVRMHLDDAERLYGIVKQYGMNETAITVLPEAEGEKQDRPKTAPGR